MQVATLGSHESRRSERSDARGAMREISWTFARREQTSYNPNMASIEYFPAPVTYNSKKPPIMLRFL